MQHDYIQGEKCPQSGDRVQVVVVRQEESVKEGRGQQSGARYYGNLHIASGKFVLYSDGVGRDWELD